MMAINTDNILCPYYKRERKKSITCEDTVRRYSDKAEKRRMIKSYCSSRWKDCPYADALNRIYEMDIPEHELKEKIMENQVKEMQKEINKLMRENGQLTKKLEVLKAQIEDRDKVAEKNHEMYMKTISNKDKLLKAKDENIKWLESFASAFLVVAYGEQTREIRISKERVLQLMTGYSMKYRLDPEEDTWVFEVEHQGKDK